MPSFSFSVQRTIRIVNHNRHIYINSITNQLFFHLKRNLTDVFSVKKRNRSANFIFDINVNLINIRFRLVGHQFRWLIHSDIIRKLNASIVLCVVLGCIILELKLAVDRWK